MQDRDRYYNGRLVSKNGKEEPVSTHDCICCYFLNNFGQGVSLKTALPGVKLQASDWSVTLKGVGSPSYALRLLINYPCSYVLRKRQVIMLCKS